MMLALKIAGGLTLLIVLIVAIVAIFFTDYSK